MELSGPWKAHPADDELRRFFPDADLDDGDWADVTVPDHWRNWPGFDEHDGGVFVRTRFRAPAREGARTFLHFDGVCYQGDVWLDGEYVGDTEGWFFPHAFEITDLVAQRDEHLLAVEVTCPPAGDPSAKRTLVGAIQGSPFVSDSWNPGGIWRPVRIERTGPVAIRFFRLICASAGEESATLALRAVLVTDESTEIVLRTRIGDLDHELTQPLAAGENRVEWTVSVPRPELWWPHVLGDQPLHDVEVDVVLPDGSVSDRRRRRTGLRSIQLRNWQLSVNGERLFTKGASIGPTAEDLANADPERITGDVRAARDAGLDLLRVHSHIARPELYRAADESGMLLWQDFPLTGGYARSVGDQATRQAREMVDRLGHHPSIMLWCCHDEPDPVPSGTDYRPTGGILARQRPTWNRTVLDRRVKQVVSKFDSSRPVIAHAGVLPHLPQLDGTSAHLWFGWKGGRAADLGGFVARLPRLARFVSAFGAQAVPVTADFVDPDRWPRLDWDRLAADHGLDTETLLARVPATHSASFAEWQQATQRHQASVLKTTIELLRRIKYRPCGGFTLYHLADAHPAISHSLLDHERRPKPAYQAVVDACRPVIVVAEPMPVTVTPGDVIGLDIHVVSDLREPIDGARIKATLELGRQAHTWRWEGDIPADDVVRVGRVEWTTPDRDGPVILDLELQSEQATVTNRYRAFLRLDPAG